MKTKVTFINLKEHLLAAARRGLPVKIRLPWYNFTADSITEDEAETIFRDMKRAGDEYFERNEYDKKRLGK